MSSALRLLRTLAPLKPVQVYGRLLYLARRPTPRLGPPPPRRELNGRWIAPRAKAPSLLGPTQVRLLNETGEICAQAWNDPHRARLWTYNLHYFDDLTADSGESRTAWHVALIDRWTRENLPGQGAGWEPYPVSMRVVNWIKASLAGVALPNAAVASLAVQLRWLARRLEWHLLGNHLLANAKALVFGGLFFDGPEAEGWLAEGLAILADQLPEQILSDGGHFERSPMYHALVLEDVLDLINLGAASAAIDVGRLTSWRETAGRMEAWLAAMTHPDGEISFFNDAAFGVAARPAHLSAYARRLGLPAPPPADLGASGSIRLALGPATAILDAAPIGPDYLPGHAHADTLSFELSVGAERVIVNGGTSVYGEGLDRMAERGTASHSTVQIGDAHSSEVWAGFRVGRRARVFDVRISRDHSALEASAAHDGYRALPGRPVHRRHWRLTHAGLTVEDRIEGGSNLATARFHLHPEVRPTITEEGRTGDLTTASGRRIAWRASAPGALAASQWRPEFGKRIGTQALTFPLPGETLRFELDW